MLTKVRGRRSSPVVQRYATYGLFGGLLTGLLIGVLAAGPYFYVWPVGRSLLVVVALALLGSVVGRWAIGFVMAIMSAGGTASEPPGEDGTAACGGGAEAARAGEVE